MVRRVGITGGIGSGKSTVLSLLGSAGAVVLDADALARKVVTFSTVRQSIVQLLGPAAYAQDGRFDRAAVRELVFVDPDLRTRLEAITHPAIASLFEQHILSLGALCPTAWVFYEASLLVEADRTGDFDAIVLVTAPVDTRLARVAARSGLDRPQALAIMAAQASDDVKRTRATVVVENDGSRGELEAKTWGLLQNLRAKFSAPPP